jgi:hypothetical protein
MMTCNKCYGWVYDTLAAPISNTDPKYPYMRVSRGKIDLFFDTFHRSVVIYCTPAVYSQAAVQEEMNLLREQVMYSGIVSRKALKYRQLFATDWVTEKLTMVAGILPSLHEEHTMGSRLADAEKYIDMSSRCPPPRHPDG